LTRINGAYHVMGSTHIVQRSPKYLRKAVRFVKWVALHRVRDWNCCKPMVVCLRGRPDPSGEQARNVLLNVIGQTAKGEE
jgi:hypothetical protein